MILADHHTPKARAIRTTTRLQCGTRDKGVCGRKVWRRSGELITGTVSIRTMMDALRTLFLVSSILVQEAYGRYPGLCCGLLRPTMGWSPLHFLPPPLPPHLFLRRFGEGTKLFSLTTGTQFLTYW